ncbi:MAG: hypothetical protein ACPG31_12845 [Planctomycetota bacterium]
MKKGLHEVLVAGMLLCAAWRGAALPAAVRLQGWTEPGGGPQTFVPDLQHDDALRLSWLPGVGPYRAQQIVAQRPFLQVPLLPRRLSLLPGIGETTAEGVAGWYARQAQGITQEESGAALE